MRQGALPACHGTRDRDGSGAQRARRGRREYDQHHPPGRVYPGRRRRRGRARRIPGPHPRDSTADGGDGGRQRLAGRTCILCVCRHATASADSVQRRHHVAASKRHGATRHATNRDRCARAIAERARRARPGARDRQRGHAGRLCDAVDRGSRTGRSGGRDRAALELAGRSLAARADRDGRERSARDDDAGRGAVRSDGRADPVRAAFEDSPRYRRRAGETRRSLDLRRRSTRGRKPARGPRAPTLRAGDAHRRSDSSGKRDRRGALQQWLLRLGRPGTGPRTRVREQLATSGRARRGAAVRARRLRPAAAARRTRSAVKRAERLPERSAAGLARIGPGTRRLQPWLADRRRNRDLRHDPGALGHAAGDILPNGARSELLLTDDALERTDTQRIDTAYTANSSEP